MNFYPSIAQQPLVDQYLHIIEDSRSHSDTALSVGPLWTSDQSSQGLLPDNTQHSQQSDIHSPRRDTNIYQQVSGRRPTP